jgi:hypothetical protein
MTTWDTLPAEQRARIERGGAAAVWLKKHEGIERWREVGIAANDLQQAAMDAAHTNRPVGKGYNGYWAELAAHVPDLRDLNSATRTHAMWLATEWATVNVWLDTLTHEERWRLNHPTAIRRRYDARHNVPKRDGGDGETGKLSPVAGYKQRCAELESENAQLREQLKHARKDGSLFNLESDTGAEIGKVLGNHLSDAKWRAVKQAADAAQKAKRARASHAS